MTQIQELQRPLFCFLKPYIPPQYLVSVCVDLHEHCVNQVKGAWLTGMWGSVDRSTGMNPVWLFLCYQKSADTSSPGKNGATQSFVSALNASEQLPRSEVKMVPRCFASLLGTKGKCQALLWPIWHLKFTPQDRAKGRESSVPRCRKIVSHISHSSRTPGLQISCAP